MVVNYLHAFGSAFRPRKTHPILIVDPYDVLTFTLSLNLFQPVAWRNPQVIQLYSLVDLVQLPKGHTPELLRPRLSGFLRVPSVKDVFRALVFESINHLP